jgi:hypothetical protein
LLPKVPNIGSGLDSGGGGDAETAARVAYVAGGVFRTRACVVVTVGVPGVDGS